jgi:hypothetical protein
MAHGIERLEIEGDAREEIRAELEAEAQAREDAEVEAHYQDWKARQQDDAFEKELPPGWENAPLSAQVAYLCTDTPEEFDALKAYLKGE